MENEKENEIPLTLCGLLPEGFSFYHVYKPVAWLLNILRTPLRKYN